MHCNVTRYTLMLRDTTKCYNYAKVFREIRHNVRRAS